MGFEESDSYNYYYPQQNYYNQSYHQNYQGKSTLSQNKSQQGNINKDQNIINSTTLPRGLKNIGATCYMNSVIQSLYHIFDLSNELFKSYFITQSLRVEHLQKMPMASAFFDVIYHLSFSEKKSVNPQRFKNVIGNNESFRQYEANDSKTLTLYILDTMNKELNENKMKTENPGLINAIRTYDKKDDKSKDIVKLFNDNYNSLIGDLFHGLKSTEYKCLKCKNSVKNYEIFNIFTCSIEKSYLNKKKQIEENKGEGKNKGGNKNKADDKNKPEDKNKGGDRNRADDKNKPEVKNKGGDKNKTNDKNKKIKLDVIDCFKLEQNTVKFSGNNQLFCEKCNELNDGESNKTIVIAPKILILFLDRGINNRFMMNVDFPMVLDINEFFVEKGKKYHLRCVIEHLGESGDSGHFIANCKHFDGNWYLYSDSSIYSGGKEYQQNGIPYLIFYEREN